MISYGRKSDEKCCEEEVARSVRCCDKGILRSGRNVSCCLILGGKIMFSFRRSQHLRSLPSVISSPLIIIMTYSTSKSLRKILEVMGCHIKIKRNLMAAFLLILCDCRVAISTLFKHFLRSDRPQLSSACTKNQLSNVPREIFNLKRNRPRNLREQICNCREQVVPAGCT